jgi:predicted Zn finger-like uncharacterized protein
MGRKISIGSLYSTFQYPGQHAVIGETIPKPLKSFAKPDPIIKNEWLGKSIRCPNCKSIFIIDKNSKSLNYGVRCLNCNQSIVL